MQAKCALCPDESVTRVLFTDITPAKKSLIPEHEITTGAVHLCGTCAMLYCEETIEADGPPRSLPAITKQRRPRRKAETSEPTSAGLTEGEEGWALYILEDLERSGYHLFIRSDGREIILSHENGLPPETRSLVERNRKEITRVLIDRLYQGGV